MNLENIEAIKYFKECIAKDTVYEEDLTLQYMKETLTILEKQQEEIKQLKRDFEIVDHECSRLEKEDIRKDMIINEMAEYIEDESTVDEFCSKENCYADNYEDGHCQKCLKCIKQYFERKCEE